MDPPPPRPPSKTQEEPFLPPQHVRLPPLSPSGSTSTIHRLHDVSAPASSGWPVRCRSGDKCRDLGGAADLEIVDSTAKGVLMFLEEMLKKYLRVASPLSGPVYNGANGEKTNPWLHSCCSDDGSALLLLFLVMCLLVPVVSIPLDQDCLEKTR